MDRLIPIFPLDLVLFPGQVLPLHIFEPRYKELIGDCLTSKEPFGIVRAHEDGIAAIGCTAEIIELTRRYDDGRLDIQAAGRKRFEIVSTNEERSFLRAMVLFQEDEIATAPSNEVTRAITLHREIMELLNRDQGYENPDPASAQLSYHLAEVLPVDLDFKQALLATRSEAARLSALINFYEQAIPKLRLAMAAREKAGGNGHVL